MTCCELNQVSCNQGRDCPTRLHMQMHRIPELHTEDGGKAVSGGYAVSIARTISDEAADVAPVSADKTAWGAAFFLLAVFVSVIFAGIIGACKLR